MKKIKKNCDACMMPLKNVEEKNDKKFFFCKYCDDGNGGLNFSGSKKEFIELCYTQMKKSGMGKIKAKIFSKMIAFAPYWKNKK